MFNDLIRILYGLEAENHIVFEMNGIHQSNLEYIIMKVD